MDELYQQVVLTVQNNGNWYRTNRKGMAPGSVGFFSRASRPFIKEAAASSRSKRLTPIEYGYVVACLWHECDLKWELSGPRKELSRNMLKYYRVNPIPASYLSDEEVDGLEAWLNQKEGIVMTTLDDNNEVQPEVQPEKEPIMKTETIAIKHTTTINGVDISTMTTDQLIDAIKTCEAEVEALGTIKTKSKAIDAKVKRITGTITELVEFLDAK